MSEISKYASRIYRCGQIFYDEWLAPYHIGCGQQFFLLHIYKKPGISPRALAENGYFDKGTTARALKKLEDMEYIKREIDEKDHRIQHLYLTEKGEPLIAIINEMLEEWHRALFSEFDEQQQQMAEELMERMSINAIHKIGRR